MGNGTDAIIGGVWTACSGAAAVAYWMLLVHPKVLFSLLHPSSMEEDWLETHPGALRAARIAGALVVFLLGLITGMVWSFLARTQAL